MKNTVIVSAKRTPIGSFMGTLSSVPATELGATAIAQSLKTCGLKADDVDEVIMGQVLQGGTGQAPARQAALGAGLASKTACTTVNKVCGSGLKAIMMGAQSIALGQSRVVVAGGMESMSNAPYFLPGARGGFRMGDQKVMDLMIHDGLFDPYGQSHMGSFGDLCAREYGFSRQDQDEYAARSYEKALAAQQNGWFKDEMAAVKVKIKGEFSLVAVDEEPGRFQPQKMGTLKPAFDADGTVTAGNASKLNDGAAAVVLMSEEEAGARGLKALAKIVAYDTFAHDPQWFTTAPSYAMKNVLKKAGLAAADVDLFEINEAFSMVPMSAMKTLSIAPERVNVFGGAVALGHPIGCSGARVMVTLLNALAVKQKRLGCASLCLGGGEAVAMIVERI